jgi:class 3 adenylate cyclase
MQSIRDKIVPFASARYLGERIPGFAVNLAARVEQACDDGAIFVSSTVCDLLLDGDACFDDRGEYQLKGFDRSWRLFSVATPI